MCNRSDRFAEKQIDSVLSFLTPKSSTSPTLSDFRLLSQSLADEGGRGTLVAMACVALGFFTSGGGLIFPAIVAWATGYMRGGAKVPPFSVGDQVDPALRRPRLTTA